MMHQLFTYYVYARTKTNIPAFCSIHFYLHYDVIFQVMMLQKVLSEGFSI
jgi:hypothetical protein